MASNKIVISDYVKEIRKRDGLTLRDFADKYNVSKSQVEKYERGSYDNPTVTSAKSFCKTFGISYDEFIADYDIKDNEKIIMSLGTTQQIKTRLGSELDDNYYKKVCWNFYNNNFQLGLLNNGTITNKSNEKGDSQDNYFVDKHVTCYNKKGELISITYFYRPLLFPNMQKSLLYKYLGRAISDVACYSSDEFNCKNFVFITPSKDEYNYFVSKKYDNHNNSVLLVYVKGYDNFTETKLLFGKNFL